MSEGQPLTRNDFFEALHIYLKQDSARDVEGGALERGALRVVQKADEVLRLEHGKPLPRGVFLPEILAQQLTDDDVEIFKTGVDEALNDSEPAHRSFRKQIEDRIKKLLSPQVRKDTFPRIA